LSYPYEHNVTMYVTNSTLKQKTACVIVTYYILQYNEVIVV
jgi:hypothetical protein